MKLLQLIFVFTLLVTGCGTIENSSRLLQALDKSLFAGVGDAVIEVYTQENLPNIVGHADIFGRTRPTGKTFVIYLGMERGRAAFERHTIRLQSNATAVNSSDPKTVSPTSEVISDIKIRHYLDPNQRMVVDGYEIFIMEATSSLVRYRIRKLN